MSTITVHRAGETPGCKPIEPATIIIAKSFDEEVPPLNVTQLAFSFTAEADNIADALFDSLPQATTQRLMIRLMSRYASQYLGGPRR